MIRSARAKAIALPLLSVLGACSTLLPDTRPGRLPVAHLAPPTSATPSAATSAAVAGALAIDLPTAIELAGARSSDVRLARVAEEQARNTTLHEWFAFVPQVIPFFRAFDHVGQAQPQTGANIYVTRTNFETQVVVFNLWNPGPVVFSALAARRREAVARHETEVARQDAVARAAIGYLELVRAHALVGVARDAVLEGEELVRLETSREERGAGTRAFVLRARSELADRRQDLAITEGEAARASALLVETLQLEPGTVLVPREVFPVPLELVDRSERVEPLTARALAERPELASASEEVAAREKEHERALYGPLAPFAATYLQTGVFGATLGTQRFSQDAFVLVGWHLGPGGILDVPAIQIASGNVRAEHLEMRRLRARVQLEVAEAKAALVESEGRLSAARAGVEAASELLRLSKDRLAKGAAIELEVVDAARVAARARGRLVAALVDVDEAQYALLRATGSVAR